MEIKRCPFCGGEAEAHTFTTWIEQTHGKGIKFYVECKDCFSTTGPAQLTKEKAIEAWNRRADNG